MSNLNNKYNLEERTAKFGESQETKHWLRMLLQSNPEDKESLQKLWKEAQELTMMFQKITNTLNK